MRARYLVAALVALPPACLRAQSALTSSGGQSAIAVAEVPMLVAFNSADKRIAVAASLGLNVLGRPAALAVEASGKASNSVASILSSARVVPDAAIGGQFRVAVAQSGDEHAARRRRCVMEAQRHPNPEADTQELTRQCIQRHPVTGRAWSVWLFGIGAYRAAAYRLFDESQAAANQVVEQAFSGFDGRLGVNAWHVLRGGHQVLWAASGGWRRDNSIASLAEVEIVEETVTPLVAGTRVARCNKVIAFAGVYDAFRTVPVNADAFFVPGGTANGGLWGFSRIVARPGTDAGSVGGGIFVFQDRNPLRTVGAIAVERRFHKRDWVVQVIMAVPIAPGS